MIILDVRKYKKSLTLKDCADLYEDVVQMMSPLPVKLGIKGRVQVLPDELWVTQWQSDNIFKSLMGSNWEFWRGIPIKVMEVSES